MGTGWLSVCLKSVLIGLLVCGMDLGVVSYVSSLSGWTRMNGVRKIVIEFVLCLMCLICAKGCMFTW